MMGSKLGRYEVEHAIGRGGMGEVYLGRDPVLERAVAIKVLAPEFGLDPERRARLVKEARAASALNHPNILTVHDLGEENGVLYVAMELVEGETLRVWARSAQRSPAEILHALSQAARALGAAHDAGLVHRDLKPENLMIRTDGLVKVLDFGLARSVSPGTWAALSDTPTLQAGLTKPGMVMGTTPYMSPEQVLGQPAGPASDIFSLGVVLYELLTGRHPFAGDSAVDTMHRILHEAPPPPSKLNPSLTRETDFVTAKTLAKDPGRRHATARDLAVDLETLEIDLAAPAPGRSSEGGPRAIAVLPFKAIGGKPEEQYLGVGLADAVITRLSHSPDLIVRTTATILPYENQAVDPRRIGQELGVYAILDASFQSVGSRFRATARLVETATGKPLWAGKVDLSSDDIFEVQDKVAQGIVEALTVRLTGGKEQPRPAFVPSPAAYEHYMRGVAGFRTGTVASAREGIAEMERAVALEPEFAEAWSQLGLLYHSMVDSGFDTDPAWYEKEEKAVTRALTLDPGSSLVRFASGAMHLVRGRKPEAYRDLVETRRLSPNYHLAYHFLGYLYRLCDQFENAVAAYRRSIDLEPYAPWSYGAMVRTLSIMGRFEEAEAMGRLLTQKAGRKDFRDYWLWVYTLQGRIDEALRLLDHDPDFDVTNRAPGSIYLLARAGRREESERLFAAHDPIWTLDMDAAAFAAAIRAYWGDHDGAFRYLDRAVELGNDMLTLYTWPGFFPPMDDDPRWKPFLDRVRARTARWKEEFRWPPEGSAG